MTTTRVWRHGEQVAYRADGVLAPHDGARVGAVQGVVDSVDHGGDEREKRPDGRDHVGVEGCTGTGPQVGFVQQHAAGESLGKGGSFLGLLTEAMRPDSRLHRLTSVTVGSAASTPYAAPPAGVSSSHAPLWTSDSTSSVAAAIPMPSMTSSSTRRFATMGATTRSSTSSTRIERTRLGFAYSGLGEQVGELLVAGCPAGVDGPEEGPVADGHLAVLIAGEDVEPGPVDPAVLADLPVHRVVQSWWHGRVGCGKPAHRRSAIRAVSTRSRARGTGAVRPKPAQPAPGPPRPP